MFAARFARSTPRAAAQLRATTQRRFASTQNEFIAERQHLKEHAKGTTGTFLRVPHIRGGANWPPPRTQGRYADMLYTRAVEEDFHLVRSPDR